MADPTLEEFGRLLMTRVRDEAIEQWDMIISGQMKDADSQRIHRVISHWPSEHRKVLEDLIPQIVDTTLHHLMWTVEQQERVRLSVDTGAQLREVSDGLPGDLIGWREKFSRQRKP